MVNGIPPSMVNKLTGKQRKIVSAQISKEVRSTKKARQKFKASTATRDERTKAFRSRSQIIAIGFSKARQIDPSIPDIRRVR